MRSDMRFLRGWRSFRGQGLVRRRSLLRRRGFGRRCQSDHEDGRTPNLHDTRSDSPEQHTAIGAHLLGCHGDERPCDWYEKGKGVGRVGLATSGRVVTAHQAREHVAHHAEPDGNQRGQTVGGAPDGETDLGEVRAWGWRRCDYKRRSAACGLRPQGNKRGQGRGRVGSSRRH